VRVTGLGGAQVSCDGAVTFAANCLLDEWSFAAALDLPPSHVAENQVWVKTTQAGNQEVKLRIENTETTFTVPVISTTATSNMSGHYVGIATSPDYPEGVPVKAYVWDPGSGNSQMGVLLAEVVRRRVTRFFDSVTHCVTTHGGIVEKFAGDAVMAAFGIPQAHEDDAERAVRAALAIRDSRGDLAVHRELGRAEHRAHAALAEHRVEPVASVEGDPDQALREALRHTRIRIAYRS